MTRLHLQALHLATNIGQMHQATAEIKQQDLRGATAPWKRAFSKA